MTRHRIQLTDIEYQQFRRLRPLQSEAFYFWKKAAYERGLDPETVLSLDGNLRNVTALPLDHGQHWCYPLALKCKKAPIAVYGHD